MNDMNKEPGTVKLFRAGNISVFVHWSLPVVTLLLSIPAIFGFEAALAVCLAYVFILVLHESAHALAARHFGLKVYSLTISAMGGGRMALRQA